MSRKKTLRHVLAVALLSVCFSEGVALAQDESIEEKEYWDQNEEGSSSSSGSSDSYSSSSSGSSYNSGSSDSYSSSGGSSDTKIGLGLNTTLSPTFVLTTGVTSSAIASILPAFTLRIWLDRLMIEPLLGLVLLAGDINETFGFTTGALIGYALDTGNLRPIFGGGFRFAFVTDSNVAFSFGPMLGLEYRFEELPNFSLEAAWFFPFNFVILGDSPGDPFVFQMGTAGSFITGVHWYF